MTRLSGYRFHRRWLSAIPLQGRGFAGLKAAGLLQRQAAVELDLRLACAPERQAVVPVATARKGAAKSSPITNPLTHGSVFIV